MVADTYSASLGLILQGTGNNNNNWGLILNSSMIAPTDRAIAGVATHTDTGGSLDLSTVIPPAGLRLDVDHIQLFTATLSSNLTVTVPNVSKTWRFWNRTSGAFNLYVKVPGGVARSGSTPGGLVQIPQGCIITVIGDGNGTLIRGDDRQIGDVQISVKAAIGPGELTPNGASLLKADYPDLHGKISTTWGSVDSLHFTLPDFTANNRFLRAAGGALAVGTYQSNQNAAHTHSITGTPAVGSLSTDSQGSHTHAASVTDPGHIHNAAASGGALGIQGGGTYFGGLSTPASTGAATTGISVTNASAGAHTHTVTGTLSAGTLATASQGGTEARPESAAVLFGIRY